MLKHMAVYLLKNPSKSIYSKSFLNSFGFEIRKGVEGEPKTALLFFCWGFGLLVFSSFFFPYETN